MVKNRKAFQLIFTIIAIGNIFVSIFLLYQYKTLSHNAAAAESEAKLHIGEYDGIVVEKDGGKYTIRSLNGDAEYRITHDVYDSPGIFPVGSFVRFSFHADDPAEYKYSGSLLHLSENTLATAYDIYGEAGAEAYRAQLGLEN